MNLTAAPEGPVLDVAARTDPGLKRSVNEDAMLAADPCFLVADGMGGHDAGDRASRAAIAVFGETFTKPGPATLVQIETALEKSRAEVRAISDETVRGAGCTISGVIRVVHEGEPYWYVLNVGDSRVYLNRGSELAQLTQDHSLLEESRGLGYGDARPPRNVITRALGSDDDRHDAWLLPLETGARLLICTDGLTTEVPDEELRAVLTVGGKPKAATEELLRRALAAGGRDNVSLVVVDVVSGGVERQHSPVVHDDDDTIEQTRPGRR